MDESVTPAMRLGGAVILAGTSLVLGWLPRPRLLGPPTACT